MCENTEDDEKLQSSRASLRAEFLKSLMSLQGKSCTINTYELNKVDGDFKGFDVDLREFLFDNLKTPFTVIPNSIVRAEDIILMEFHDAKE